MPQEYAKTHLTFAEQVAKLADRGLIISNPSAAEAELQQIGYYRLSAYLHTLRPIKAGRTEGHDEREDRYVEGSTFAQAVALWEFDRALRMVLLDGLEQFEIQLRTALAYYAGKLDPFVHHKPDLLTQEFTSQPPTTEHERMSAYDKWLVKYLDRVESAKNEAFVKWFAHKYDGRLPIWTAIEILEFGQTARLIQGLPLAQRRQVSESFGIGRPKDFGSWIATLNGLRNTCAHHSRTWNRTLVTTAARPPAGQIPDLDHLRALDEVARVKIYAPLAILAWLLGRTDRGNGWKASLIATLDTFPILPQGTLANAGFPGSWKSEAIWQIDPR